MSVGREIHCILWVSFQSQHCSSSHTCLPLMEVRNLNGFRLPLKTQKLSSVLLMVTVGTVLTLWLDALLITFIIIWRRDNFSDFGVPDLVLHLLHSLYSTNPHSHSLCRVGIFHFYWTWFPCLTCQMSRLV